MSTLPVKGHDRITVRQFTQDILMIPSRIITHLRKVDAYIEQNMYQLQVDAERNRLQNPNGGVFLRGPWSFFTSGYVVTLLAMALLLNRIQHLVVPQARIRLRRLPQRASLWTIIVYSVLPLNFSSTLTRFILRIPSLFLLAKSLLLLSTILLQSVGMFPSWEIFQSLGYWANSKDMADVSWIIFCAACAAIAISAFTRGLDGSGPNSSFNLFGYAFMLHLYASPGSYVSQHSDLTTPGRPDKNALITIYIPLLQLFLLHAQGVFRRWRKRRLVPTTICGILSLLHFLYVMTFESPSAFPIINFIPSVLEALLVAVILLACSLNAISQLLLEGHISRPIFGNGARSLPSTEEEFAVALLRLGTSSLEATSVAGLGNEVADIPARDESLVELDRSGTVAVIPHLGKSPFAKEIRSIKARSTEADGWIDYVWMKELRRFCHSVGAFARGFVRGVWASLAGLSRQLPDVMSPPIVVSRENTVESDSQHQLTYLRFLSGETVTDDEGEFIVGQSDSYSSDDGDEDGEEEVNPADLLAELAERESTPGAITPVLIAHLTTPSRITRRRYSQLLGRSDEPSMSHQSQWSTFVRSRREQLSRGTSSGEGGVADAVDDERRRQCVVCISSERVVICWPCRCLSMCDDCRSNLASRLPAPKHTCPCCRQQVEGYSRIFIP